MDHDPTTPSCIATGPPNGSPSVVTLPGAFVGVLLSTGSPVQAGAVQILILLALLLSQTCAVALTIELIARGAMARESGTVPGLHPAARP